MWFHGGKYDNWLLRPLMLLTYISFLLVQFLCITGPDSAAIISPSVSILSFKKAAEQQDKSGCYFGQLKKTKLTINKRFQHAIGAVLLPAIADLPAIYSCVLHIFPIREYLAVSFILSESLRGPPSFIVA